VQTALECYPIHTRQKREHMPVGVEPYRVGYRATFHLRPCTFPTPEAAAAAREELVAATRWLRIRQRIRKLEHELQGDSHARAYDHHHDHWLMCRERSARCRCR
jgi:hypothetical protein